MVPALFLQPAPGGLEVLRTGGDISPVVQGFEEFEGWLEMLKNHLAPPLFS